MFDWPVVLAALPDFFRGLRVTLILLAIALATGFVLSIPLAMARVSQNKWLSMPVFLFTYVIRGTPLLVQMFMVYHGLAQFAWMRQSAVWFLFKDAWFCAWLVFSMSTTAYTTEIFAGALRQTPAGELEAAQSLGMTKLQIYARILWPGALRRALPQYSNEVVGLMHATAVASTVTLVEITRVARDVYYNHLSVTDSFGVAAIFYFVLTFTVVGIFKLLEMRYLKHLNRKVSGPVAAR
ncbi:MAG: ABC transporter permease subunit [Hyphomicrobiales bacterium]|jgi:arginine/ornithine transport system permease protein|nr:ABC transporter permease subunit [Hyphomicrobiales bacterium]